MIRQTAAVTIVLSMSLAASAQTIQLEQYTPTYERPTRPRVGLTDDRPAYDEIRTIALQPQVYRHPYASCQPRRYSQAQYRAVAQRINSMPGSASTTAFRALSPQLTTAQLRTLRQYYNQTRTRDRIAENRRRYSN